MNHFQLVVKNRIADHQAKEVARLAAETARIAEQERLKAEAAATARANAEIAAATAAAQADAAEAIAKAVQVAPVVQPAPAVVVQAAIAMRDAQVDRDTGEMIKLGQICTRLGFTLTADFVASLGFLPAATDKSAKLYRESDFPRICQALVMHISHVSQGVTA